MNHRYKPEQYFLADCLKKQGYSDVRVESPEICIFDPLKIKAITYYPDVYLADYQTCIELDEDYHDRDNRHIKDKRRDELMNAIGIRVLRIPATFKEINANIDLILSKVKELINSDKAVTINLR